MIKSLECPVLLTKDLIPVGRANRSGGTMAPKYITIHDTGNSKPGADAKAHALYLKGDDAVSLSVSWHFTVDDKGAYQHLPLTEHGWHCGDGHGPGNLESVAVEVCENADGDRAGAEANAAQLVAWLLHVLRLDIKGVVTHRDWSGKDCPHILLPRWAEFVQQVRIAKYRLCPDPWDPVMEIGALRESGLINSPHAPGSLVTWGELATVLNRMLK